MIATVVKIKKTTQDEEMSTVLIITLHEGYHHFSSI